MIATDNFYYFLLSKIFQRIGDIHKKNYRLVTTVQSLGNLAQPFIIKIHEDSSTKLGWKWMQLNDETLFMKQNLCLIEWAHGDLNPGSSPCKGDVITDLDYEPRNLPC